MSVAIVEKSAASTRIQSCDQPSHRMVICGGGTAGHVTPGIAIAEAYRHQNPGQKVTFLGHGDPFLKDLVTESGFDWKTVPAAPWSEQSFGTRLRSLTSITSGFVTVRRMLKRLDAKIVLGLGGHASVSGVLAGRSLGIPTAIFEPNVEPGLANRMLGRISQRVIVNHASTTEFFSGGRTTVTGTPIRQNITQSMRSRKLACPRSDCHVLVTGGSLGSEFLNRNIPSVLNRISSSCDSMRVTHQVGCHDRNTVAAAYDSSTVQARVVNQIQRMETVYRDVDIVISAGGAITLAELDVLSMPTFVVPLEWATHDHQANNAEQFVGDRADRGWVREKNFDAAELQSWIIARLRERRGSDESAIHIPASAGDVRTQEAASYQVAALLSEHVIACKRVRKK